MLQPHQQQYQPHYKHREDRHQCNLLMNIGTRYGMVPKNTIYTPQKSMEKNHYQQPYTKNNQMDLSFDPSLPGSASPSEEEKQLAMMIEYNLFHQESNNNNNNNNNNISSSNNNNNNNNNNSSSNKLTTKSIDKLMDNMCPLSLRPLYLTFDDLYRNFNQKFTSMLELVSENKSELENVMQSTVDRVALDLLALDKSGAKLVDMIESIESLYYCSGYIVDPTDDNKDEKKRRKLPVFVDGVMNNYKNVDYVRSLIRERVETGANVEDDDLYNTLSSVRKRGRKKKTDKPIEYDPIEKIAQEYIKNPKPGPDGMPTNKSASTINHYPTFHKCIETIHRSTPDNSNHGWFTRNLIDLTRVLKNEDFPAHGLLRSITNMSSCVASNKIRMSFDSNKKRYYCAITGEEIMNGEEVCRFLFIENDAVYEKNWIDYKIIEPRVFESDDIKKSVHVYLVKLSSSSTPITLFPNNNKRKLESSSSSIHEIQHNNEMMISKMSSSDSNGGGGDHDDHNSTTVEKKRKIEHTKKKKKKLIYGKSHMINVVNRLLDIIRSHPNQSQIQHKTKSYVIESERLRKIFHQITLENFQDIFDKILYYLVVSTRIKQPGDDDDPTKLKKSIIYEKNCLFDTLIDFILILDTPDISYTSSPVVIKELFRLSQYKRNPALNRFVTFCEWDSYMKDYILFFIVIADFMKLKGLNEEEFRGLTATTTTNTMDILGQFDITINDKL
jgi:hypothetical protein